MFRILRKYLMVSENEWYGIGVVSLFLGFMFAFRSGGTTSPDIWALITTILTSIILVIVSVTVRLAAQKLTGLYMGYATELSMDIRSLLVALLVWFLSNGYVILPLYGAITINPIQELRFGYKPGFKFYHLGWIAATGSVANLLLALLLRLVWNAFPIELISHFALINVVIAIVMALPIPSADGLHLFFASRIDYVAYFTTMLFFSFLLLFNLQIHWLVILTVLFAFCTWIGYWLVEKNIK